MREAESKVQEAKNSEEELKKALAEKIKEL